MSCHILQQMGHVHAYATAMAFSLLQVECDELLSFTSAAIVVSEEGKSQLLTVPKTFSNPLEGSPPGPVSRSSFALHQHRDRIPAVTVGTYSVLLSSPAAGMSH